MNNFLQNFQLITNKTDRIWSQTVTYEPRRRRRWITNPTAYESVNIFKVRTQKAEWKLPIFN